MHSDLIQQSILNAIYGGPAPSAAQLRQFMREWKVPLPGIVTAFSEKSAPFRKKSASRTLPKGAAFLHLHPGTVYLLQPSRYKTPPFPKFHYARAENLIMAIQQAILALRQGELSQLDRISPRTEDCNTGFTLQEEGEAFRMAIQAILKDPDDAGPAVEVWSRIVLHRHQKYLHSIHLKFIEMITALTYGQDIFHRAYPYYSLVSRILSTYLLRDLAGIPHIILKEIGPLASSAHSAQGMTGPHSPAVEKAFAFMEASFHEPLSLTRIARASHVSSSHLCRIFKQETGRTVVEHLQRLRIHHATELLASSPRSLVEVALDCGFESIEHFYRLFRRFIGTTPRSYRLQSRNVFTRPAEEIKGGS